MFIESNTSQNPNAVRCGMLTRLMHMSPLQGFQVEGVSYL